MTDAQFDIAISILRGIERDVFAIKQLISDASATIDRILALPLPARSAHAQA